MKCQMKGGIQTTSCNIRKPFLKLLPIRIAAVTAGSVNSLVDTLLMVI